MEVTCTLTIEKDGKGQRYLTVNGHGHDLRDVRDDMLWLREYIAEREIVAK